MPFYISPNGNDAWSGLLPEPNADGTDGPFATVAAARQAVRAVPREPAWGEPVAVRIDGTAGLHGGGFRPGGGEQL